MSSRLNQTYFECYEFDVNIVLILITIRTYISRESQKKVYITCSSDLLISKPSLQLISLGPATNVTQIKYISVV